MSWAEQDKWGEARGLTYKSNLGSAMCQVVKAYPRPRADSFPQTCTWRAFCNSKCYVCAANMPDHDKMWFSSGIGWVYTTEPYDVTPERVQKIRDRLEPMGLEVTATEDSPYHRDTTLICVARPGVWNVLQRRADGDKEVVWEGDRTTNLWAEYFFRTWFERHGSAPVDLVDIVLTDTTGLLHAWEPWRDQAHEMDAKWRALRNTWLQGEVNKGLTRLSKQPTSYALTKNSRSTWSVHPVVP